MTRANNAAYIHVTCDFRVPFKVHIIRNTLRDILKKYIINISNVGETLEFFLFKLHYNAVT